MAYTRYRGRTPQPGERQCNPQGSAEYAAWHYMHMATHPYAATDNAPICPA